VPCPFILTHFSPLYQHQKNAKYITEDLQGV
jgi:hypothetical protein